MKRCPECRRDYLDDSLLFCLSDGTELVYGVTDDEPATAIYSDEGYAVPSGTKSQADAPETGDISSTDKHKTAHKSRSIVIFAGIAVLAIVAYFGYRSFRPQRVAQINSVAVMPFVNVSGNSDTEYLSDGITESLISSLSQISNLNVKARSSVFRYKDKNVDALTIGKELGVQAILNGTVLQRGDNLALHVELVDAATENALWSKDYKESVSNIVSLQSSIAGDVSRMLNTKLSGADERRVTRHYTDDPQAYELYLKGRYFWNKRNAEGMRKAVACFQEAIDRDPNYALAYSGLADAYSFGGGLDLPPKEVMPKAKAAAMKALEIDEGLAEAHAALGHIMVRFDLDWQGAETEFKRALELDPKYASTYNWYSVELSLLGRFDEAVAMAKRGQELEPLSMIGNAVVGLPFYFSHQYDQAITEFRKTVEMDPSFETGHDWLSLAYEGKGMYREAVTEDLATRTNSENIATLQKAFQSGGWAGYVRANLELRQTRPNPWSYSMAIDYARLGENDKAITWLEKAYEERNTTLFWVMRDPRFDGLRSDPRFVDLLRRVAMPKSN